jgi:hypothetical protein
MLPKLTADFVMVRLIIKVSRLENMILVFLRYDIQATIKQIEENRKKYTRVKVKKKKLNR